jgi:vitamin B12 transporter
MVRIAPLALLSVSAAAGAQPAEIIVTGQGLPDMAGESVYSVATIGRERLAASSSGRLDALLHDVPGFQLFRRSDSRSAHPTAQGATLRALGGNASSRALLLLDGVPQTDPFGGWLSWPAYHPRRLGSVRVVRGGGTGAAGPGALAGTIELTSAAPDEIGGLSAGLAYGSRNGVDLDASAGIALGRGFLTVSGAWARGDGFVPIVDGDRGPADRASPYDQKSVSARAVAPLAGSVELQAGLLLFGDARERGTAFSAVRSEGADASLRLVGTAWSALVYIQTRDFYTSFAAVDAGRTAATRTAEQYAVPATGTGARIELRPQIGEVELRIGSDWRGNEGRTQERYQFVAGRATRGRLAGGRTDTVGAFAEAGWEGAQVTLHGGVRFDHWAITRGMLRETVLGSGERLTDVQFSDRSGWLPTGRAGLAWRPSQALALRGAFYVGWRLPALNELYRPFRVGPDATAANAELTPERLKGVEAGAEYRPLPGARIGLTLFANRLEDAIANVTLGQGPGTFPGVGFVAGQYRQRRNLDAIVVRGVEFDGSVEVGRWRLSGGYSFASARIHAAGPAQPLDGLRPAQTPRHSLSASLAWLGPRGRASIGTLYSSGRYEDDLNRQRLAAALTFDAVAEFHLRPGIAIQARAENLLDTRVEAGISGGAIERATPRMLWIGLRVGG